METRTYRSGKAVQELAVTPAENLLCAVHERFHADGMIVIAASVQGVIDANLLEQAFRALQRRHPRLRACIVKRRQRFYEVCEAPPPIPLETVDGSFGDEDVANFALRLHASGIPLDAAPMARAVLLRDTYGRRSSVLLAAPHAVLDGISAKRVLADLFGYYRVVKASDNRHAAVDRIESLPLLAPSSAPLNLSRCQAALLMCRLMRDRVRKRLTRCTPVPETSRPDPRYREITLSDEETRKFLRICKVRGCGVYGAVAAVGMTALRDALGVSSPTFSYRCPIDMRNILQGADGPVGDLHVGCFLSAFESAVRLPAQDDFWELAGAMRNEVAAFVRSQGPSLIYNILRLFRVKDIRFVPRRGTIAVNSLGVVDTGSDCDGVLWDGFKAFPKWRELGPYVGLLSFTVRGRLTIAVGTAVVREDVWRRFAERVAELVRAVSQDRHCG